MGGSDCTDLADFLDDALTGGELQAFIQHLERCPACQQAAGERQRLDQLVARAVLERSPVPSGLVDRIERRLRTARRRRIAAWSAGVAAAVLLAVGVVAMRGPAPAPITQSADIRTREVLPAPAEETVAMRPHVVVVGSAPDPVVAVPVPTRNPNVTILWLHPAPKAAARRAPASPTPMKPSTRSDL